METAYRYIELYRAGRDANWDAAAYHAEDPARDPERPPLLVAGSERLLARFGLSETVFGMTFLALAVSVEELARELPAARRGRPEISFGNVAGSILAFFLCNAGLIALIRPVVVDPSVMRFYLPVCLVTVAFATACLATLRVPRWAGGVLVAAYVVFFAGAYLR
jgi:cation:H+ antiporter